MEVTQTQAQQQAIGNEAVEAEKKLGATRSEIQELIRPYVALKSEIAAGGGTIRVRTRVRLGRAEILIANDVPIESSQPGSGMALNNVRERLRLMHDVAAQFEARRDGQSFRVQILVPL
jgi:two-component system sensor histidine kinase AlgZ